MAIRKRLTRRILLTGGATALAVGASAGVALAVAITFTISPGGAITATAGKTTLKDTNTGSVLTLRVLEFHGHAEEAATGSAGPTSARSRRCPSATAPAR